MTCQQVHAEAAPILYKDNSFDFDRISEPFFFARQIGDQNNLHIKKTKLLKWYRKDCVLA